MMPQEQKAFDQNATALAWLEYVVDDMTALGIKAILHIKEELAIATGAGTGENAWDPSGDTIWQAQW